MTIYHELIIPHLCTKHLQQSWAAGHLLYAVIQKKAFVFSTDMKEALLEFDGCPLELAFRLHIIREELNKRGFPLKPTITPFDVSDEPFTQYLKEKKRYTPWKPLYQQLAFLKEQNCKCKNI